MTYKFIAGFVLVAAVAVGGYYVWSHNSAESGLANLSPDTKVSDEQVAQLVARISKFLVVPPTENPSVAVIKDAEHLALQQPFYKGAKDGDILMLYSNRAIIYDAKANKLVNVGPVIRNDNPPTDGTPASASLPAGQAGASVTPSASPTPSVAPKPITIDVLNGTSTAGLAGATASTLKKNRLFGIGKVGDAKGAYTETVIVDLTKDAAKAAAVAQLAKELGVSTVTTLPSAEAATTADAVVLIGKK